MSGFFLKVLGFINQKIFRQTKESSLALGGVISILKANILHAFRTKRNQPLKLQNCNETLQFPLPNRWSSPDQSKAKQQLYMIIKQVALNLDKAGVNQRNLIDQDNDRSKSSIEVMRFLKTIHVGEIDNVQTISKRYNVNLKPEYIPDRELLFADSFVNGEHSYMLRRYGNSYYDMKDYSQKVDKDYRTAFESALQNETWNTNSNHFGLSREDIILRVKQGNGVYSMLFEQLQKISDGKVIINKQEMYVDSTLIDEIHYLNTPYPIFLRVDQPKEKGGYGYICIAIGFRINGKVQILSPFFASQNQPLWRLAQSHLAQAVINDFSLRVHLGVYHFTTNQYHVPVYRFLQNLKSNKGQRYENYKQFLDRTYTMFSRGLQGVNVAATASLVHPIQKYSLVNKVFNLSQRQVIDIIAGNTNLLKIYDFNPPSIVNSQGITKQQAGKYFEKIGFDIELYHILSDYIKGVYDIYEIDQIAEGLLAEINEQTKHMGVKNGSKPRPGLRNKEDVLRTLQNLCFCWVGFHSHTFSTMSTSTYTLMRPSMLKKPIPDINDCSGIKIGEELPDSKVIMEFSKLNQATTQRDSDNYLNDNIRRQLDQVVYLRSRSAGREAERYRKLQENARQTLKRLEEYEAKIVHCNRLRQERGDTTFAWMLPSQIQTSLNI